MVFENAEAAQAALLEAIEQESACRIEVDYSGSDGVVSELSVSASPNMVFFEDIPEDHLMVKAIKGMIDWRFPGFENDHGSFGSIEIEWDDDKKAFEVEWQHHQRDEMPRQNLVLLNHAEFLQEVRVAMEYLKADSAEVHYGGFQDRTRERDIYFEKAPVEPGVEGEKIALPDVIRLDLQKRLDNFLDTHLSGYAKDSGGFGTLNVTPTHSGWQHWDSVETCVFNETFAIPYQPEIVLQDTAVYTPPFKP